MTNFSDRELLRAFLRTRSQRAFEILVNRYMDLVYSVAFRKTDSVALAEEVSQMVFVDLANKAEEIRRRNNMGPWLHRATVYQANKTIRTELRRRNRERSYTEQQFLEGHWQEPDEMMSHDLRQVLDEGISRLVEKDRELVVWYYFEERSLREIAGQAKQKEDTVRKRLQRAVVKLSRYCQSQQGTFSAVALLALLTNHSVEAAPAGLAKMTALHALKQTSLTSSVSSSALLGNFQVKVACIVAIAALFGVAVINRPGAVASATPMVAGSLSSMMKFGAALDDTSFFAMSEEEREAERSRSLARSHAGAQWWHAIESPELNLFVARLSFAGFSRELILAFFESEFLRDRLTSQEQLYQLLDDPDLLSLVTDNKLKDRWSMMAKDPVDQLVKNLERAGMPDELIEIVIAHRSEMQGALDASQTGKGEGAIDSAVSGERRRAGGSTQEASEFRVGGKPRADRSSSHSEFRRKRSKKRDRPDSLRSRPIGGPNSPENPEDETIPDPSDDKSAPGEVPPDSPESPSEPDSPEDPQDPVDAPKEDLPREENPVDENPDESEEEVPLNDETLADDEIDLTHLPLGEQKTMLMENALQTMDHETRDLIIGVEQGFDDDLTAKQFTDIGEALDHFEEKFALKNLALQDLLSPDEYQTYIEQASAISHTFSQDLVFTKLESFYLGYPE